MQSGKPLIKNLYCAFVALIVSSFFNVHLVVAGTETGTRSVPDNEVSNESDFIAGDVDIEGVAIINDQVFIDGVRIKKGVREVTSGKTGRTYRINRSSNGNVTVTEK